MAETSAEHSGDSDEAAYSGLFGAIPYALRASRSWLFKSYVIGGGLVALVVTVLMGLALVTLIGQTATVGGGTLTLSRAFYVVVGLFVVGPLLAPILLVARRHRRHGGRKRYDAALAVGGFVFLGSLYVGFLISVPPRYQEPASGAFAPVIQWLYALPPITGLVPPVLAAVFIIVVHRIAR